MNNISSIGTSAYITASKTLPFGWYLKNFADDQDGVQIEPSEAGGSKMDLNGKLLTWAKAAPIIVTVSSIPHSSDDEQLSVILNANRPGPNQVVAGDSISMVLRYPDNTIVTLTGGVIVSGPPASSAQSSGRLATRQYTFHFEDLSTLNVANVMNKLIGGAVGALGSVSSIGSAISGASGAVGDAIGAVGAVGSKLGF